MSQSSGFAQVQIVHVNVHFSHHSCSHNLKSRLFETAGQHTSSDTVGDELRDEMAAAISEVDPFNLSKDPVKLSYHHSSGSPFASLTVDTMSRFLDSVKESFSNLYVDVIHPGMGD